MTGRVLILSNNRDLSNELRRSLESNGHSVATSDLSDVAEAIHIRNPHLLIVDLILHGSIVEVWKQLRYDIGDVRIPNLAVIPKNRVREIELLEGISDFIVYPYDVRELETRLNMILRQYKSADTEKIIRVGNLAIDPVKYEVTVDGWPVVLTLKEYELLKYLATHRERVITREILLDQIWGYNYYGGTRTVDVHIGRLRTKIETGKYSFIKTVRGVGYIFSENFSE